jgi:hypothetical protein
MLVDGVILAVSILYYVIENKVFKVHLFPADALFAGYGLYKLIYGLTRDKKAYTTKRLQILTNTALLFIPVAYLVTFALNKVGLPFDVFQVGVVLIITFSMIIISTPRLYLSDRKVVLEEHKADMDEVRFEPYSLYVSENIFIPGHQRFRHEEMIGLTGVGKTRYGIYPSVFQDIHNGAGVFIYDIKNDMLKDIQRFASYSMRDHDLYVFTLGNVHGETYNPLANGTAAEIANRVFTALYPPQNNSNQFYTDYAQQFLSSIIALLKYKYPVITFKDLYLLAMNPRTILKEMALELEAKLEAKYLLNLLDSEDLEDRLTGLCLKLSAFVLPEWTKQINTTDPDIRMDKLLVKNKILLFQASSGLYQAEYKPISILALKDIQTEIARRYEKPPEKPFFIYLDEFYNVIYPDFGEMINKARSARVGLILAHQSIGDLERCGEELRNIIIDNTVHKVIFKVGTPETASFYAEYLGTRLVKRQVESHKDDGKVAGFTDKEEREFLIDPDTIKNLKTDSDHDTAEAVLAIETNKGRVYGKYLLKSIQVDFTGHTLLPKPERKNTSKDTNLEAYMHLTERKGTRFFKSDKTEQAAAEPPAAPRAATVTSETAEKPKTYKTFKTRANTPSIHDLKKKVEEPGNE